MATSTTTVIVLATQGVRASVRAGETKRSAATLTATALRPTAPSSTTVKNRSSDANLLSVVDPAPVTRNAR